ncbi:MAG: mechanosensitive ion channel family protein [Burkholderiales bacterium]|jgi:small-conductance mechanosensitive channel|nr:MAG: mechanosensitive ion channel family protein [Burkholderiales bacterium]
MPISTNAESRAPVADGGEGTAVMVSNRQVLVFRVPYLGMSPAERARRAMRNIEQALDMGGPGQVTVKNTPQGLLIFVDGLMTVILADVDVDPMSGETLDTLTTRTVQALQKSIRENQESRDTHHLLLNLAMVGAATLLAVVLYQVASFVRARSMAALLRFIDDKAGSLGAGASEILRRDRLIAVVRSVDLVVRWLLGLLLAYAWLSFSLLRFPYTRPWGEGLHHYLVSVAVRLFEGIVGAVPDLIIAVLILLLARGAAGVVSSFFTRIEQGHLGVHWMSADSAGPTRRIATWGIWLFALAMAYPYLPGAQTEAFKGMSVLVGLMMSLGASSLVGQVAGGLILTYSSMLRKGEYVRIGDHEGTVVSIGAFNTRIRTGLGEEITLPNSLIVGSATKNYSRAVKGLGYVVDTVVTIGYDTPWRQVHAMLIEAAKRTPGVLLDPAPTVFQTSLSDFYPEYRLVCQAIPAEPRPRAEVLANLHAHIQDVFNENGVQIMSPHYMQDPDSAKVVPPSRWFTPPAQAPREPG